MRYLCSWAALESLNSFARISIWSYSSLSSRGRTDSRYYGRGGTLSGQHSKTLTENVEVNNLVYRKLDDCHYVCCRVYRLQGGSLNSRWRYSSTMSAWANQLKSSNTRKLQRACSKKWMILDTIHPEQPGTLVLPDDIGSPNRTIFAAAPQKPHELTEKSTWARVKSDMSTKLWSMRPIYWTTAMRKYYCQEGVYLIWNNEVGWV